MGITSAETCCVPESMRGGIEDELWERWAGAVEFRLKNDSLIEDECGAKARLNFSMSGLELAFGSSSFRTVCFKRQSKRGCKSV